jgi:hypothetical protein
MKKMSKKLFGAICERVSAKAPICGVDENHMAWWDGYDTSWDGDWGNCSSAEPVKKDRK